MTCFELPENCTRQAHDGAQQLDLVTTGTLRGARAAQGRLEELFLQGVVIQADDTRQAIAKAEAIWKGNDDHARAQVDAYYASGKHKHLYLWIAIGVITYIVGMLLFFTYGSD